MIPAWTMLIIAVIGSWSSSDVRMQTVPFMNKEACVKAAKDAASSSSSQLGFLCINSETGENIRFQR